MLHTRKLLLKEDKAHLGLETARQKNGVESVPILQSQSLSRLNSLVLNVLMVLKIKNIVGEDERDIQKQYKCILLMYLTPSLTRGPLALTWCVVMLSFSLQNQWQSHCESFTAKTDDFSLLLLYQSDCSSQPLKYDSQKMRSFLSLPMTFSY